MLTGMFYFLDVQICSQRRSNGIYYLRIGSRNIDNHYADLLSGFCLVVEPEDTEQSDQECILGSLGLWVDFLFSSDNLDSNKPPEHARRS